MIANLRRLVPALACAALVALTGSRAAGQAQTLFSDDFHEGTAHWTVDNGSGLGGGLWHAGVCGSGVGVSGLVSYNNGPCNYQSGGPATEGSLISPPVVLTGQAPFYVSLVSLRKLDNLGGDHTAVSISDAGVGNWTDLAVSAFDNSGAVWVNLIPIGSEWAGKTVQLRLHFVSDGVLDDTLGWEIDSFAVINTSAWIDLALAHAGSAGLPHLAGNGTLTKGPSNTLSLTHAKPSSPAALFFGLSQLDAPFKSGVLVPQPLVILPMSTSAAGTVTLPLSLPAGIPPATPLYFQFWIQDPGASNGFSASNALKGSTF